MAGIFNSDIKKSLRKKNLNGIYTINVAGISIPHMVIFPRANFKDFVLIGAPLGTIRAANLSGWSREQLFLEFLECFIKQSKPTKLLHQ